MKENNYIEQFDELFKQQLGNASAPVPPGVWEGISSSVGSGAGVASVAAKTALWMKAVVALSVIGVVSAVTYGLLNPKAPETITVAPVVTDKQEMVTDSPVKHETEAGQSEPQLNNAQSGSQEHHKAGKKQHRSPSQEWNNVSQSGDVQSKKRPKIQFYEIKDEVSNTYLSKMNENVIPGFDSAKMGKQAEEKLTEIPYIPEKQATVNFVDSSFIYIPNVVTPNGDGVNDEYLIDIKGEEFVQIIIYNSRSVKVFETRNKNTAWDCKMPNGEIAPEGDYVVKVIYKFKNKSKNTSITPLKLIK